MTSTPQPHPTPGPPANGGKWRGSARRMFRRPNAGRKVRAVEEVSAGGLVVDRTHEPPQAALIGRLDRRGQLRWSLPKGHLEEGETNEDAAIREVQEETGILGKIVASIGSVDYWFLAEDRRIHKTVHHFLLEAISGELSDADVEVTAVAWVPLGQLRKQLAYDGERKLVDTALELLAEQP